MKILKCLTDFFGTKSTEPIGLCSFEHSKELKKQLKCKRTQKKELRLSELME